MKQDPQRIDTQAAPRPLGAYAHAARAGQLLFISGQGARDPATGRERGVVLNADGSLQSYDIREQTRAALANLEAVVRAAGGTLEDIVDVTVFLLHMTDFPAYNEVYAEVFGSRRPARTTVGAASLPGNNAIEIKAVACLLREGEPQ
ncbi:MAG TPA: RidA family protein [Terriglobales bacterium]|nr:RidA family protein [Terriglobales bacterium]